MDDINNKLTYTYTTQFYLWTLVYTTVITILIVGTVLMTQVWWILIIVGALAAMSTAFLGLLPRSFEETESEYIVHQLFHKSRFPKSEFIAEKVTKSVLKDSVRTFATGGAFGYTGYWWSPMLKNFYCMVANVNQPLMTLTRKNKEHSKKPNVYLINGIPSMRQE